MSLHTQEKLQQDLQRLGLVEGDTVYIHTSLRAVGKIEGGAVVLIEALRQVVGKTGTLAVPTHTLSFVGLNKAPYDKAATPTVLGAFPEIFRNHPDALRSGHGSHSSAAMGFQARYLTENHNPTDALGESSPLYKLWQLGGKILLLGVTHTTNTSIHLAESVAKVPYLVHHYDASWGKDVHVLENGVVDIHTQVEFPGCSNTFDQIQPLLEQQNKINANTVGNATAYLMNARDLIATAVSLLKTNPAALLCDKPNCPACPARRAAV